MKETLLTAKIGLALLGGLLSFMFGELDAPLKVLILFVIIDYVTGLMCAVVEKTVSSEVGAKGLARKIGIFLLVALANVMDMIAFNGLDGFALRTTVIFFYISNEGISIIENAGRLGIPIPKKVRDVLEQLNNEEAEEPEDEEEV